MLGLRLLRHREIIEELREHEAEKAASKVRGIKDAEPVLAQIRAMYAKNRYAALQHLGARQFVRAKRGRYACRSNR